MKSLSSFYHTIVLALILSFILSGASLLFQQCTIFSAYRKPLEKKMPPSIHLFVDFQGPCGVEPSWLWFSLICLFSHISGIDPPCIHFVKLEQRGEKYKSTGSAVRSQTLCSDVISITLTDSIEDSPNDDLMFSFEVASPQHVFWNYFFSKCYKNKNITNQSLTPLFDFFYGVAVIFFFNLENDAGNFISLGFYFISRFCWKWVGPKVGFYNRTMWIISSLEAGSSPPLCSLI